jgi:hypothetical protein
LKYYEFLKRNVAFGFKILFIDHCDISSLNIIIAVAKEQQ